MTIAQAYDKVTKLAKKHGIGFLGCGQYWWYRQTG
jgi:hypothetical protein